MNKYTYKITEGRLLELLKAENTLDALQSAGVDNWSGYGDAIDLKYKDLQNSYGLSPNYPIEGVKPL